MKTKLIIPAALASMLSLAVLSSMAATNTSLLGETAPAAQAMKRSGPIPLPGT
jgi:hypothetical protein